MDGMAAFGDYLALVEGALVDQLGAKAPDDRDTLLGAARHLCLSGGKRARPLLVKIFADTLGLNDKRIVDAAVAAELIHAASLLHDDVVDMGMFRRHRPTVNARWGNTVAVLSGDLLLSGALLRLAQTDARLAATALSVVSEMTRGAILEVESRGNLDLPMSTLRQIGEEKTGALFGWCGVAAATLKGDLKAAEKFERFGRKMGVAFQMADDIRDITGAEEGKTPFADLQSRTPSLTILLAAQRDASLKKRINDAWGFGALTAEKMNELGTAVMVSGAVEESIDLMNQQLQDAVKELGEYASHQSGANLVRWATQVARGMTLKAAA
jgi:heptaprenyl diphosphate synthase